MPRHHHTEVGIDDLFGFTVTEDAPQPRASKSAAALKATVAACFLGVVVAAPTTPVIVAATGTVEAAHSFYDSMPSTLPATAAPTRSVILAADGSRIAQFYSEDRVEVSTVPDVVRDAVVAIEDSRFFSHDGVDARGIARAVVNNAMTDSTQGGSTLTQQYVKNALLNAAEDDETRAEVTSRTSYMRKIREAKLALEVEKTMSKDEILLGYLNISYFGDGAYGVGTAARHYFNKPLAKVTLAEAALLAGLVKNPTGYDPTDNLAAATQRRNVVLGRMRQLGYITDAAHERAVAAPVRLDVTRAPNGCTTSKYPFYCQWVREHLASDPTFASTQAQRDERLFRGGLTIKTALDPKKQQVAQTAVDKALSRNNRVAAVAVTVEPGTGHVVAMAQNRTWGKSASGRFDRTEMVLATQPAMQPGSVFKPITLATALERGLDPRTTIYSPYRYAPPGQAAPAGGFTNYSESSGGNLDAYGAVARSSNTWFVKVQEQVGVLNVASMAERLGISSIPRTGSRAVTPRDASLTLGTYEVSPVEMAGAYATFAAHGVHCTPVPVVSVTDADGQKVPMSGPDCHEAIPASVADTVADVMQATITGDDEMRTGKAQAFGRPAAGKTGTTQDTAAVWFSGFTPQFATSVWVGDPRGGFAHPLRGFYAYGAYVAKASGGSVAGPIWREVMAGVHRGVRVERFRPASMTLTGGTTVPDVRGLPLPRAYRMLTKAGFEVALDKKTAKRDPVLGVGVVASTTPSAGTFTSARATVRVRLSAGSRTKVRLPAQ